VLTLASFKTSLNFETSAFENANSETTSTMLRWSPYVMAKFGEVWSTHPWESSFSCAPPLKLHVKTCSIVNDSAVDYSISLEFCTEFKSMTPEMLQKFQARRSKAKTPWHAVTLGQIFKSQ